VTKVLVLLVLLVGATGSRAFAGQQGSPDGAEPFDVARALFYNGQYAEAAALSRSLSIDDEPLAVYELRTSALLFQLRRLIGEPSDKAKAVKACAPCPGLLQSFSEELTAGQAAAHAVLRERPNDSTALFYLGKLDLNYVWLVLGTLGRRTGWNEYWEARHSLDAALALEPDHLRARTARAWIDYIVDTRMPWGTGWVLGGGNRKKALAVMQDASESREDFYATAEALFGLWDMQLREKKGAAALETARRLATMFPANPEVARFVASGTK
jgi:tetratricopeptide (TPR) repeat protein